MKLATVFVSVGTDPQPFDRLLKEVDSLVQKKILSGPVFCQTGYSKFIPKNADSKPFLTPDEFEEKIKNASLVITHGGAGAIGLALLFQKKCIAVPRYARFGEHVNDHQLELVDALANADRVLAVRDISDLHAAVKKSANWKPAPFERARRIIGFLNAFVRSQFGPS